MIYTAHSSHGELYFDGLGNLIAHDMADSFGPLPAKLDFDSMRAANPGHEVPTDLDILCCAYWLADGTHVPVVWDLQSEEA
jgi:hypothetical protein